MVKVMDALSYYSQFILCHYFESCRCLIVDIG
jgi:hypothetical protein